MIHAHSLFTNGYIAMRLAAKYHKPYIVAVRNGDINLFFKKLLFLRPVGRRVLQKAQKVIFLSESYRKSALRPYCSQEFAEGIAAKSVVIPNGIDNFWFDNRPDKHALPEKQKIRALYVGEIVPNKNIIQSARALEMLRKEGYDVSLFVAGRIKSASVAKELRKYDFVTFLGQLDKSGLLTEYRNNDIFLMPSKTEAFGLVYAEAMSQGMPVIYTRNQGFDEQFPDGTVGYAVNSDDCREIKDRIKDIIERYEEISDNCLRAVEKFSWDKLFELYKPVYDEMI